MEPQELNAAIAYLILKMDPCTEDFETEIEIEDLR